MKAREIRELQLALEEYQFDGDFTYFKSRVGAMLINNKVNFRVSAREIIEFDDGKRKYQNFEIVNVYVSKVHMRLKNAMSQIAALENDNPDAMRKILSDTWKRVIIERGISKPKSN